MSETRNRHTYTYLLSNAVQGIPNSQWSLLNTYQDIKVLLIMSGVEQNPGPSPTQQLRVAHVNINSVTTENRIDELLQFVQTNDIKICAITETKLDNTVSPTLYKLEGYQAPLTRHRNRSGGGVALYSHVSLPIKRLTELELEDEEWIWAKIKTQNLNLVICCIYLPPNLTASRLQLFIDRFSESICLAQKYSPNVIMVLGDFNTGNIYLDRANVNHSGITSFDYKLKSIAHTLDLEQLITQPTRTTDDINNLRDLIFTDNVDAITDSGILSSFSHLDHFPIYATVRTTLPTENTDISYKTIWDYGKLDAQLLTRLLLDTDWDQILDNDIDSATDQFISAISTAAAASIPKKRVRDKNCQKPWATNELMTQIRKRDRLFRRARQTQTTYDWDRWKYQRNTVTATNIRLKRQHIENQIQKLLVNKRDPYKYHQTLRAITGRTHDNTIPPLEGPNGDILTDDYAKATLLNDYFARQSTLDITDTLTLPTDNHSIAAPVPTLNEIKTSEREVLQILNSLDCNKSTGPDEIPAKLLKLTALIIAEPLSKLFNMSLSSGVYPSKFKEANIKPIFKNKGSPSDYSCYRPISLLSSLSKVFERIVYKRIYSHISEHSLLTDKQSGYRRNHSTEQQLLYLTHNLYKSLDSGRDFTAIYLDISRYFDKIWHDGLLHKCRHDFGITDSLFDWLKSYLCDRKHRVQINSAFSTTQTTNAGCPQGSVLGPLLALMYLDKLSGRTKNDILFFADDTSLYASHTTADIDTVQLSLQHDLDEIHKYGREWAITFNTSKTVQQTFSHRHQHTPPALTFGGDIIPIHDNHTHLGMTFSKDLRFHQHVNAICNKVHKTLSPLYPIARYIPRPILDQIYKTYIRPHFDYCDTIYDGHITIQDATRLEILQHRAGRLVTGTLFRTSTDKLLQDLGWDKLTIRRRIHKLTLYHSFNNPRHHSPNYITQIMPETRAQNTGRTLRNASTHTLPPNRTTSFHNSFFLSTGKLWNNIPESIRSLSHSSFKRAISERLGAPRPPIYYEVGSKIGNVLHTRLRNEMSHLNSHLFKINKIETPECSCGHKTENTHHFLLSCPNYVEQRGALFREISRITGEEFCNIAPTLQLRMLLHGDGLGGGDGGAVAYYFQIFLLSSGRFAM